MTSSTSPRLLTSQPPHQAPQRHHDAIFLCDLFAIWIFQAFSIFWLLWNFEATPIFHEYPALFMGLVILGIAGPALVVLLRSWHRRTMAERAKLWDLERNEGKRAGGCEGEEKVESTKHCRCCRQQQLQQGIEGERLAHGDECR